jgi:hypothetical protein
MAEVFTYHYTSRSLLQQPLPLDHRKKILLQLAGIRTKPQALAPQAVTPHSLYLQHADGFIELTGMEILERSLLMLLANPLQPFSISSLLILSPTPNHPPPFPSHCTCSILMGSLRVTGMEILERSLPMFLQSRLQRLTSVSGLGTGSLARRPVFSAPCPPPPTPSLAHTLSSATHHIIGLNQLEGSGSYWMNQGKCKD